MTATSIDLRNPTWPIAVIREALASREHGEVPAVDERAERIEGGRPQNSTGRAQELFVEHQIALVWRIAWWAESIRGELSPQSLCLEAAVV